MSEKSSSKKPLNKQLEELEELVAWFEREDIDLEEAIQKFEEGNKLAGEIKERLNSLENKITVLKEKFEA